MIRYCQRCVGRLLLHHVEIIVTMPTNGNGCYETYPRNDKRADCMHESKRKHLYAWKRVVQHQDGVVDYWLGNGRAGGRTDNLSRKAFQKTYCKSRPKSGKSKRSETCTVYSALSLLGFRVG